VQIDAANSPTGVYSHLGSVIDATPASSLWRYNQLGFFLYGGSFTGSIIVDDVNVALTDLLSGDYNGDGSINAADYTTWRDSFGQSGNGLAADGDGNGVVDDFDYGIWKDAFFEVGSGGGSAYSVPEASVSMMMGMVLAVSGWVRRRGAAI
jgi:hypothetical protein